MCGEQPLPVAGLGPQKGSPPRVRGTVSWLHLIAFDIRITPACAGNSTAYHKAQRASQDHPRMCGEQKSRTSGGVGMAPSPPHVRGTKSITHGSSTDPRITPACAGNSSFMRAKSSAIKDHPRVCGEQARGKA